MTGVGGARRYRRTMSEPGQNLVVPSGPGLPSGATIPAGELVERFSRSPGPGGQSVNTSDTRVELLFAPASSTAFTTPSGPGWSATWPTR